jgi:hypothetical protein
MNTIEDMKKKRFQFLNKLYKLTGGDEFKWFNMFQIGKELGFDNALTENIAQYLRDEGLIEFRALGGIIGISHQGVREIEKAFSNPDIPTSHFPPINIIAIGQMISSQIQQASPEATQVGTINEDRYEELKKVIQSLKESIDKLDLDWQHKSDIQAEIQTIEAQMSSSKPKVTIITECLGSIRRILEGATGSMLASSLLSKIVALLRG